MKAAGQTPTLKGTGDGPRVNAINGDLADADLTDRVWNIYIRFGGRTPSYMYEPGDQFDTTTHPLDYVLQSGDEVRWYNTSYR